MAILRTADAATLLVAPTILVVLSSWTVMAFPGPNRDAKIETQTGKSFVSHTAACRFRPKRRYTVKVLSSVRISHAAANSTPSVATPSVSVRTGCFPLPSVSTKGADVGASTATDNVSTWRIFGLVFESIQKRETSPGAFSAKPFKYQAV